MTHAEIKQRMVRIRWQQMQPKPDTLVDRLMRLIMPAQPVNEFSVRSASTLHHLKQIERLREPAEPESEAGKAIKMKLVANSGRFVGLGTEVIECR